MNKFYLTLLAFACFTTLRAQISPFSPAQPLDKSTNTLVQERQPTQATYLELANSKTLSAALVSATPQFATQGAPTQLQLISPGGEAVTFNVFRYQMISDELQAAYPELVTLQGWDVNNPGRRIHLDWSSKGFSASVLGDKDGRWVVERMYTDDATRYHTYYTADFPRSAEAHCGVSYEDEVIKEVSNQVPLKSVGDCQLREYRLALACTGEYYAAVGGNETDVVAEMVRAINRVNEVYRADLAITFRIINLAQDGGAVQLVYDDPDTDPYTNADQNAMLDENQATIDAVIGSANYDVGHVFSTSAGGVASLSAVCEDTKARGVTGSPNPTGDPYYIDLVAHELGHQCGGTHTFNSLESNCSQREADTAYEPGSGTTIMAYAGICDDPANVQANSDPFFHAASIRQILAYMESGAGSTCATIISTANTAPVTDAGLDYTIPAGTPFVLTAETSPDPDGDNLSYSWEQLDLGPIVAGPPTGAETEAPLFRSLPEDASPQRYLPNLTSLVAGIDEPYEVLPTVSRELNFILTTRDLGDAGYGCATQDQMLVTVVNTGTPFSVTEPNGGEEYEAGNNIPFTWNVAGTTENGISCSEVEIVLSLDGGLTFTETLGLFPNTGTAEIEALGISNRRLRAMVRCEGNIFFDISDGDFSILQQDFVVEPGTSSVRACSQAAMSGEYSFNVSSLLAYTGTVNFSTASLPDGVTATFDPASVTLAADEEVMVTFQLDGVGTLAVGEYEFFVLADDGNLPKEATFFLEKAASLEAPTLQTPRDGGFLDPMNSFFDWSDVDGVSTTGGYQFTVYSDAAATSSELMTEPDSRSFVSLGSNLNGFLTEGEVYYWTVDAINSECSPTERATSEIFSFTYGASAGSLNPGNQEQTICAGSPADDFSITFFAGDLTGPVTLAAENVAAGLMVSFSPASLADGEASTISIMGAEGLTEGTYTFDVVGTGANSATELYTYTVEVVANGVSVTQPQDGQEILISDAGEGPVTIEYALVSGADSYDVVITAPNGDQLNSPNFPSGATLTLSQVTDGAEYQIEVVALAGGNEIARSCVVTITFVAALPVEWLSFTARPVNKAVALNWEVNQDEAHQRFSVERWAPAATTWQTVAELERVGNNGVASYEHLDVDLSENGTYNYRIRQEDADGSHGYSEVRSVSFSGGVDAVSVYPNPVGDVITIESRSVADGGLTQEYRLLNSLGQVLRSGSLTEARTQLDVADLPTAIYQLLITTGGERTELVKVAKR